MRLAGPDAVAGTTQGYARRVVPALVLPSTLGEYRYECRGCGGSAPDSASCPPRPTSWPRPGGSPRPAVRCDGAAGGRVDGGLHAAVLDGRRMSARGLFEARRLRPRVRYRAACGPGASLPPHEDAP